MFSTPCITVFLSWIILQVMIERVSLKKVKRLHYFNKAFEFIVGHDTVLSNVTVHGFRIAWSDRCAISHRVSKANTFFGIKTQWQGKSQVERLSPRGSIAEVLYFRFFVMSSGPINNFSR